MTIKTFDLISHLILSGIPCLVFMSMMVYGYYRYFFTEPAPRKKCYANCTYEPTNAPYFLLGVASMFLWLVCLTAVMYTVREFMGTPKEPFDFICSLVIAAIPCVVFFATTINLFWKAKKERNGLLFALGLVTMIVWLVFLNGAMDTARDYFW